MIARVARYLALALAILVLAVFAAGYWMLYTQSGSSWVWDRVTSAVSDQLRATFVGGSLIDGFTLSGFSFGNPSLTLTASEVYLELDPDLFPTVLHVVRLQIDDVIIQLPDQPPPEEPGGDFSLESLVLPLELDVQALNVRNLRVLKGNGDRLLAVGSALAAANWYRTIVLSRLEIDSSLGEVSGTAALELTAPFEASASIAARHTLQLPQRPEIPLNVQVNAAGDLEELRIDMKSDEPHLVVEGSLLELLDEPAWDLRVRTRYLQWPLTGQAADVRVSDVVLETRGDLSGYSASGGGSVVVMENKELQFSLAVDGDLDSLHVGRLELQGAMLDALSEGELNWVDVFSITAEADIERFDPSVLTAEWPESTPVSGTARAAWSADKLELEEVRLRVRGTDQEVDAAGLVDLERGVVDVELDWRDLRWPIGAGKARVMSETGRLTVTGKPESWTLDGRIAFATPEMPQGTFDLSGTGNREEAVLTLHDSEVLGGRLAGRANYNWHDGGQWSAELVAESIETAPLAPDWPGTVNADFNARGRMKPLEIDVDITRLYGSIRAQELNAEGGIHYANRNLAVEQLQVTSGNSRLRANGSLRSEAGLAFSLEVASLGNFLPGSTGSITADGNLSLWEGFPELRMNLQSEGLAWREYRLGTFTISDKGGAPLAFVAEGTALEIGERQISGFRLDFSGSESRQQLAFAAAMEDKEIDLALDGRLTDWRKPLDSVWAGQLVKLDLQAPEGVRFSLDEPADLRLHREIVSLERACLIGNTASRICLEGSRTAANDLDVSAEMVAVPVNLVRLMLDTNLEFTQTLDGTLSISDAADRELSAQALVDISPGRIRNPDIPRLAMRTQAGLFNLDLDDGRVLSGRFRLPFSDSAAIDADFAVTDVAMGSDSRINGNFSVNLNDIGIVAGIVPSVTSAAGRMNIDIALAGTVGEPVFSGEGSLRGGAVSYAPLGLNLKNIELTSRIQEDNRIDLQSTFTAGKGTGKINSRTNGSGSLTDGLELRLTGDNLTVVDLPQVNVVADMDLAVGVTQKELSINGDVVIPRARLSPREITASRVSESDDVVIVASRDGEPEDELETESPIAIRGEVELTLGQDVVVDFDAAETRLSGSVAFAWDGPPMPVATGEYKVTGKVEAYGQLLQITEGSVSFPGVPANNPLLRIRAEREIFGNPSIRSAGVLVSGTASDIELDVYTRPATNKERALTMLVTGSDFNYEQGVGAVDVGTYIAPDLYLSYGIGLFERENVISVRYDLTKGFGIKATSGKRAEGIDLSYTIEN